MCSRAQSLGWNTRKAHNAHLIWKVRNNHYLVTISEIAQEGAKEKKRDYYSKEPSWLKYRQREFISTGRLQLTVDGAPTRMDGDHFCDGKRQTLEDKLPELFRRLEIYSRQAQANDARRARAKAAEERRHLEATNHATAAFQRDQRWQHFTAMSDRWQALKRRREFLEQVRERAAVLDSFKQRAVLREIELTEEKLTELDPLLNVDSLLPELKTPTRQELAPYLPGELRAQTYC